MDKVKVASELLKLAKELTAGENLRLLSHKKTGHSIGDKSERWDGKIDDITVSVIHNSFMVENGRRSEEWQVSVGSFDSEVGSKQQAEAKISELLEKQKSHDFKSQHEAQIPTDVKWWREQADIPPEIDDRDVSWLLEKVQKDLDMKTSDELQHALRVYRQNVFEENMKGVEASIGIVMAKALLFGVKKASIPRCASPEVERAFQHKHSIVERQIDLLQKNLDKEMSEFKKDSDNFGHVGNLEHVSELLEEVNLFLK